MDGSGRRSVSVCRVKEPHLCPVAAKDVLRCERRPGDYKNFIAGRVRQSLEGISVVQNKVWIDILAQKPNHKGDAINVVDLVCDAIQEGCGVDDRWFCIRHLDWEIVKSNPRLFIGIGQASDVPVQVCSSCGVALPFECFTKERLSRNMELTGFVKRADQSAVALPDKASVTPHSILRWDNRAALD